MEKHNPYGLTEQDFEVKDKIAELLDLLGEDNEIIAAVNGFLDQPASDALRALNFRINEIRNK